ncbi:hypothetical protein [Paraburkholderia sp. MM6662-R1]|uniref:hypothetical protein n=1 Tax=Paraburkholderia sp. MM6662-R1 TaxID=2991066 RepID=UPI003D2507B3
MTNEEALTMLIDGALAAIDGKQKIDRAVEFLQRQLATERFNTDRAVEVFKVAVDNAVWDVIRNLPARAAMRRDYIKSGLGKAYALKLTKEFKEQTGAKDQRPARKYLRFLLGA